MILIVLRENIQKKFFDDVNIIETFSYIWCDSLFFKSKIIFEIVSTSFYTNLMAECPGSFKNSWRQKRCLFVKILFCESNWVISFFGVVLMLPMVIFYFIY